MHVLQARILEILRGTLTWFHTSVARRKRVNTIFLGVQVVRVVGCSMFGNASSSIKHASRGPHMTRSGFEARRIVIVVWAFQCGNRCWCSGVTRLRGGRHEEARLPDYPHRVGTPAM